MFCMHKKITSQKKKKTLSVISVRGDFMDFKTEVRIVGTMKAFSGGRGRGREEDIQLNIALK